MTTDSTELYYAQMEADRNEAERAYFDARPMLEREGPPVATFRAGFERAYAKLWPLAIVQIDEQARAAKETGAIPHEPVEHIRGAKDCEKCGGAGWLYGRELDSPSDDTYNDTMTKYSCDGEKCLAMNR